MLRNRLSDRRNRRLRPCELAGAQPKARRKARDPLCFVGLRCVCGVHPAILLPLLSCTLEQAV
jgi:hypothetical protein